MSLPRCAALLLGLNLIACTHGGDRPVIPEPPRPEFDSKAAQAQLSEVLDQLATAEADGSLSAQECQSLADAFGALHDPKEPKTANAAFNAGVIWERCAQPARAATAYQLAISTDPQHAAAMNNLGVLQWSSGDHEAATASFERATKVDSTNPAPRNNLAMAMRERYLSKGSTADFDKAENALQNALAVDSDNPVSYENLARLYYDRGRTQDRSYLLLAQLVITQGHKILAEQGQSSAELHNLHGLLLMEQDDQVNALRAFKQATAVDTEHPEAHLNIAMIALRFRDYPTAEKSLEKALEDGRHDNEVTALLGLGVAQRGQRRYDEAAKTLTRAQEADGKDARALYNLGILYHEHIAPTRSQVPTEGGEETQFDEKPYREAQQFFERFQKAAAGRYPKEVADAKSRVASIEQFIRDIGQIEELKRQQLELEAQMRRQQQEEKERLLDIERRAREAATTTES